jgi:hypothetical protein
MATRISADIHTPVAPTISPDQLPISATCNATSPTNEEYATDNGLDEIAHPEPQIRIYTVHGDPIGLRNTRPELFAYFFELNISKVISIHFVCS